MLQVIFNRKRGVENVFLCIQRPCSLTDILPTQFNMATVVNPHSVVVEFILCHGNSLANSIPMGHYDDITWPVFICKIVEFRCESAASR